MAGGIFMSRELLLPEADKDFHRQIGAYSNPHHFDIQSGRLWDSISYHAGNIFDRHNSRLFVHQLDAEHTLVETNMCRAQCLPAPEAFQIRRILFSFSRATWDEDVYSIAEGVVFELVLGQKIYQRCHMIAMQQTEGGRAPFRVCEYCRAVYVSSVTCPGCGAREFQISESVGEPAPIVGKQFYLDITPLTIVCQMSFYVGFDCQPFTLHHNVKLWCHFEGLHARGVQ